MFNLLQIVSMQKSNRLKWLASVPIFVPEVVTRTIY